MLHIAKGLSIACCLTLIGPTLARAADPPATSKILVAKTFRATKLTGLNVRDIQGEKLGTVYDMMINVDTGKIAYIALSHGGVLGIGDKLFAVPYSELKFDHGKDEMFFVLNISKEKLEAAPGFNQNDWPNFADPNWSEKVDSYYRRAEVKTRAEVRQ